MPRGCRSPELHYRGQRVCRVFSVDRARSRADVCLEFGGSGWVAVADVTGAPGWGLDAADAAGVRAELEKRAGISFGAWPPERRRGRRRVVIPPGYRGEWKRNEETR